MLFFTENLSFVFAVTFFFLNNFMIKTKDNPKIPPKWLSYCYSFIIILTV